MKSFLTIPVLMAVLITGCAAPEIDPEETLPDSQTSQTVSSETTEETAHSTDTAATAEQTSPASAASDLPDLPAAEENKPENSPYIDENGLINAAGFQRISELAAEKAVSTCGNFTGLFDFDRDRVPEVYFVRHSGGQGLMPVEIYDLSGKRLGGFEGYCRDGFCRLSYGEDCVYVHNSYEHSKAIKYDGIQRLTIDNGTISASPYLESAGAAGDSYPLLDFKYYVNGAEASEEDYFSEYSSFFANESFNIEANESLNIEANEVSICAMDFELYDNKKAAEKIPQIYNEYISGLNISEELFGDRPAVFAFDDFDGNGQCEALVQQYNNSDWSYYSSGALTQTDIPGGAFNTDYTRYGGYLIAQPGGNGSSCAIIGVSDGKPYVHELSGYGMLIRNHPSLGFYRADRENGIFILRRSAHDTITNAGAHTWKPYFFTVTENGLSELTGTPVSKEDFSDRGDVLAVFDEIESAGGTVTGAFLRGERYLNINYTLPMEGIDPAAHAENHYKTYVIQDSVTLLDEGRGVYSASITDLR